MTALLITGAIVLDFGLARFEKQTNKSAADDAVMAALRSADGGDGEVYPFRAVCGALSFLKANRPALSGLAACTTNDAVACKPGDSTTYASYQDSVTVGNKTYKVWIKSPYLVTDASTDGGFGEETLGTLAGDTGDSTKQGCDQVGVIIKESTPPGLGRVISNSPIVTRVRSVGRVSVRPGDSAPALLMLDRTHCQVVALSAGGGGAESHIRVYGSASYMAKRKDGTPGIAQTAGSIHSDSDCTAGSPNPPLFLGKSTDGIVAYGSPDGTLSGTITSKAGQNGASASTMYDSLTNVYGTTAKDEVSVGTKTGAAGHERVTRKVVDNRYLGTSATGVTGVITAAQSSIFSSSTGVNAGNAAGKGYKVLSSCNPAAADLTAAGITATSDVFVDCTGNPGYKGTVPIPGKTVIFNGQIQQSANVSLPNAQKVYVFGTGGNGINASSGFSMHTSGLMDGANCSNGNSPNKAILVVKDGGISANGGILRLCNTSVFLLGGRDDGCLSSVQYTVAPVTSPCSGSGNGLINVGGTAVQDWTAPNQYNDMSGMLPADQQAAWTDVNGPEDLALWTETYGTSSDWQMAGGGTMHLVGVFMTPNASPFVVKGGASQTLSNAQYIASSFLLTGGATLQMTVDANNVISFPELNPFTLVR